MNDMTPEEAENLLLRAIQSGKKETSDLVSDIIRRMDNAIEVAVKKHVNGNIRDIKFQLEAQDKVLEEIKTEQTRVRTELTTFNAFRIDALPLLDDRKVITLLGKFVLWLGAIIITILTVFKLIK